jgi:SAM-dependent methyltransferase
MSGDDEASDRRPEAWSAVRRRLAAQGFHPSRRLGQNFLVDDNMVLAIARDAELPPGARVLEVGVGLGVLTDALLALGAEVVAVEIDGRLAELARERFAGELRLTLLHADALDGTHRCRHGQLRRARHRSERVRRPEPARSQSAGHPDAHHRRREPGDR